MRKAMSFHNRFWTLADLGDESNDEDDGDAPFEADLVPCSVSNGASHRWCCSAHSTQRAGWSKTLLRPAFWVAMLICHEFDSSAHLLWIRYTLMMHHLSWHQTWVAMLIYHEFDASAHCFLLLGAFDDDAIDWLLLNESQLQAWVKAPSSMNQQLPYFFLLHEGSSEFYAKPFPEPASQLADSEALWRDWLFCMKVHASSMPIPSQS